MLEEKGIFIYLKYFHKIINVVFKPEGGVIFPPLKQFGSEVKKFLNFHLYAAKGNDVSSKVRVLDLPGGSVVESLCLLQCMGCGIDPWSGN